jgi:hypothetical protein
MGVSYLLKQILAGTLYCTLLTEYSYSLIGYQLDIIFAILSATKYKPNAMSCHKQTELM